MLLKNPDNPSPDRKEAEPLQEAPRLNRPLALAYYGYPIFTCPLGGTNNKIKTMKRQASGFRDQEFFKLKILALHETKYASVE